MKHPTLQARTASLPRLDESVYTLLTGLTTNLQKMVVRLGQAQ